MSRGSKKSEKRYQHLMRDADKLTPLCRGGGERELLPSVSARMQEGLQKAKHHKDLLIEFDKTRSGLKLMEGGGGECSFFALFFSLSLCLFFHLQLLVFCLFCFAFFTRKHSLVKEKCS